MKYLVKIFFLILNPVRSRLTEIPQWAIMGEFVTTVLLTSRTQINYSKTNPVFLLNFCIAQRYDAFCTQTRHISQLKITDVIFPSCELFYLHSFEVSTIDICGWHLCISEPPSCLAVSIIGMCYGKEDGKRNKEKHSYKSVAVYSVFHLPSQNTFQL